MDTTCRQSGCVRPWLFQVMWPGQTTLLCLECAGRAVKIAEAMGFVMELVPR